ncbi:unnamed protein product, partial [Mesorhabditis belari]|uniref:Protein kinase domain-containing protein n=1 Tax=Mesorhabditis belari TaxID=2138241 RepID=A0AAF3EEI6_9BILA
MWLDWWGPPILWLFFHTISYAASTQPVAQFAMCQAKCLQEYANRKDRTLHSGEIVLNEIEIGNNTQFSLCKLGCSVSGFSELDLPAFLVGQSTAKELALKSEETLPQTVINRISLLCVDYLPTNHSINGQIFLSFNNTLNDFFVFFIEAIYRSNEMTKGETMFWSTFAYSPSIDVTLSLPVDLSQLHFRVTTFGLRAVFGEMVKSSWLSRTTIEQSAITKLSTSVKNQLWKEEQAAVELHFSAPAGQIPACSLTLSYDASVDDLQIPFQMDRSLGYLVDGLLFEHDYRVRIGATIKTQQGQEFAGEESLVKTAPCRKLAKDSGMCAPSSVENIQWSWAGQDAIQLNWSYPGDGENQLATPYRAVHFSISMRTLSSSGPQCADVPEQKRSITGTHRSVQLYPSETGCNYEIEIVVVDSRNRRSPPTKTQIIRYEKASSLIIGAAARDWAQAGMLFVMFTVVLISVIAAVTVCIRSRRLTMMQKDLGKALRQSVVTGTICTNDSGSEQWCQVGSGKQIVGLRSGYLDSDEESHRGSGSSGERSDGNARRNYSATLPRPPNMDPPQIHYMSSFRGVHSLRRPVQSNISQQPIYASDVTRLADKDGYTRFVNQKLTPEKRGPSLAIMDAVLPATPRIPVHQVDLVEYLECGRFTMQTLVAVRQNRDYVRALEKQAIADGQKSELAIRRELRAVQAMCATSSHTVPSILRFLGVVTDLVEDTERVSGLLFEHCQGGDLLSLLHLISTSLQATSLNSGNIYEDVYCIEQKNIALFLIQCCQDVGNAVKYISECGFLHRDIGVHCVHLMLPWQDAFVQPPGQRAKIVDFGLCEPVRLGTIDDDGEGLDLSRLPPETHDEGIYTKEGDIWEFGLFLYEICTLGRNPLFEIREKSDRDLRIQREVKRMAFGVQEVDQLLAEPLRFLISECLHISMSRRPNPSSILRFLEELLPPKVLRTESFYV